ncbi:MAG: phosphoribosyl-ATP diphosphatase [Clostridium sp.]|uniref:phosphoribosyl-ATP diphosphatase n=1 Tax=Clostridium sp. TaxID=1506 RepID=UPI003F3B63DA
MENVLEDLEKIIESRKNGADDKSYTAYLFKKGKEKILKKIGEEATEVVIASMKEDKEEQVLEMCDLLYHMLVLASYSDISLKDIEKELIKRRDKQNNLKEERKEIEELR